MYIASSIDFGAFGLVVSGLVLLSLFEGALSFSFVLFSSLGSQVLESDGVLGISLFFLLLSFRLGRHNFLSCHFHHNMIIITNNVDLIIKNIYHPLHLTATASCFFPASPPVNFLVICNNYTLKVTWKLEC